MVPALTPHLTAKGSDGPLDVVLGLPAHVLIVHAVVVLLPLTAVGAVVLVVSATWRERLRWVVVGLAAVATVSAFAAATSGQELMDRFALEDDPLVSDHAAIGELTRWWALLFLVLLVAYVVLERRSSPAVGDGDGAAGGPAPSRTWVRVAGGLLVVAAAVAAVQTVLTGHAGSRAVWERQVDATE